MLPAQDHKPIFDYDHGPNTGGMGAYLPVKHLEKWIPKINEKIFYPLVNGLNKTGNPFKGIIYAGLIVNAEGPKVLEFNVRFGDPEAQVIMPMLKNDLFEILLAVSNSELKKIKLQWNEGSCVCVIAAAPGYPGSPEKGLEINLPSKLDDFTNIFHSGTKLIENKLVTAGGRIVGVTSIGKDIIKARESAYSLIKDIKFKGKHFRHDIGAKAIR